jgi:Xaa-Pro aminopeptidase
MSTSASNPANNNDKVAESRTHEIPVADAMSEFMKEGWADSPLESLTPHKSIPFTKIRRDKLSKQYPGVRLVFPAGSLKVRSNDSDYQFRAHSAFSWYTGILASDCVPDSVFVMDPTASGHEALLFIHPRSPRNGNEFYRDTRYGEFWIGRRMTLAESESKYGIKVKQIEDIAEFLSDKKDSLLIRDQDLVIDKLVAERSEEEKEFLTFTSVERISMRLMRCKKQLMQRCAALQIWCEFSQPQHLWRAVSE